MKCSLLFYFIQIVITSFGFTKTIIAQNSNTGNSTFNKRLEILLDQKEYFRLETQLKLFKDNIDDQQKIYFQSFIDNAFNRNEEAIADINDFLKKYSLGITNSVKAALLLLQADSYFKQFQYTRAAENDSIVLVNYSTLLDSSLIADTKNDLLTNNALKNIPPQEIIIQNNDTVHWKNNGMGLIEIPVKFNSENYNCVFDTKANLSCITQTYAAQLGLKILDVAIDEGSDITGIKFKNNLGVADSLYIGNILVRNAVFLVMPDEKLRFFPFSIHVIIGFPIIEQLREIQFYKNGQMIIPANPTESNLHNLALDKLNPVLSLKTGDDTLCFDLDMGAVSTNLYSTYFEKYKEYILQNGKKTTVKLGGAGGSKRKDIYVIPELELAVGDKAVSLRKVNVFTEKTIARERSYGNLGLDFIDKFEKVIINFKSMYFKIE